MSNEPCDHPRIIAWTIAGTEQSASLWSCAACSRKFYPADEHPYPTADAYEAACNALHEKESKLRSAEEVIEQFRYQRQSDKEKINDLSSKLSSESNRADIAEARLRNVIGWRENDWPEGFDRRTAELVAELASPSLETVDRRRGRGCPNGCGMPAGHEEPCFVVERQEIK